MMYPKHLTNFGRSEYQVPFLEGYSKGTGKAKYTKGQRRIDEADAMNERADEIALDYDHDDFAKGGLAGVLKL